MATNFPTSLDTFTNPTSNDSLNSPSHSLQHANVNDAVEAIEAKLGIGASTAGSAVAGQVLTVSTGGTTTWSDAGGGLALVKTQTIGTAVSSVTVTDAFSATYDAYKIVLSGGAENTSYDDGLNLKLGSSTTGYYGFYYGYQYVGTVNSATVNNASTIRVGSAVGTGVLHSNFDIIDPFATKYTKFNGTLIYGTLANNMVGVHKVAASYTDFTLTINGYTMTGGTVRVYGYKN